MDFEELSPIILSFEFIIYVCLSDCPELIKEFYIEDQEVAMMSHEEADEIRLQNNNIVVNDLSDSGETKRPTPNPCIKFEQAFEHYRKFELAFEHYRKFELAFEHYRKLEQACRYYHKSNTLVLLSDKLGLHMR